ncbi:hypothetical protein EDM80_15300 [bacterium]|nr:MAG: hypothetical protein EDM80_15300 [bacterium]
MGYPVKATGEEGSQTAEGYPVKATGEAIPASLASREPSPVSKPPASNSPATKTAASGACGIGFSRPLKYGLRTQAMDGLRISSGFSAA